MKTSQAGAHKHTPGRWHAVTGQGAHINDWYIRAGERREDGTWPAVARSCSAGICNKATVEANVRLMAAAPDLLAACERVMQLAVANEGDEVFDQVRAAITRATNGGGA